MALPRSSRARRPTAPTRSRTHCCPHGRVSTAFVSPDAFPAWFRRHVIRAASRTRRAHARGRVVELDATVPIPGEDIDRIVERRTLARAFDRLDAADRLLLTLHHFWRLPVAETAVHLGVPEGTIKSRVHYAMDRLRAAFDAEDRR